jgi:hypothetical protein
VAHRHRVALVLELPADVLRDVPRETIMPVALARETGTVTVNGSPVEKGGACEASLQSRRNVSRIVVKAADGRTGTYELVIVRGGAPPSRW